MGNGLIAFLIAVSATAWIYNKLMKTTGGNTKSAVTAAAISGGVIFLFLIVILGMLF